MLDHYFYVEESAYSTPFLILTFKQVKRSLKALKNLIRIKCWIWYGLGSVAMSRGKKERGPKDMECDVQWEEKRHGRDFLGHKTFGPTAGDL
ncbi:hypothetical protein H671_8g19563 [Cricetulus griseus]|uniref:Uncharacterized protein n=1 Tax=Cricetulus griseus TaxID=10029 RepID=A0A061HZT4_CRIGR|nr:hypothetical protein H671_8g19563 [Cricetulus griseus]